MVAIERGILPIEVVFTARVNGQPAHEPFDTLQEAMSWVESFDNPTGAISYDDLDVVTYTDGMIDLAS